MRVLICPDSFKGCKPAPDVANAMRRGVVRAGEHHVENVPIADGGEGFTQAIAHALGKPVRSSRAKGSHGETIDVPWCESCDAAYFTVADIVGHGFVPRAERDPGALTTLGVGEIILALHENGCERITVGLGGSGTVDGGVGLAAALGFRFLDANDLEIEPIGNNLIDVARIEQTRDVPQMRIIAAHDVNNPLTGPNGAARVFGPPKGATPEQVVQLDAGLANLPRLCVDAGLSDGADHPGDGAAGGLGFGLRVFAGAELVPGADVVIDALDLRRRIADADLVITGEGRLDSQSTSGKAAWAIGRLSKELGVPCICIAGTLGEGHEQAASVFTRVVRATPVTMDESEGIARAEELIEEAAFGLPELAPGR